MADRRIDLGKARILVTNDDGIAAPGLDLLEKIACDLAPDVWIVAPEQEQSGASHSLTTRRPLRLRPAPRDPTATQPRALENRVGTPMTRASARLAGEGTPRDLRSPAEAPQDEFALRRYAVDGTPTDCVMLATRYLLKDRAPDLVLSGVNAGGNVGEDLTYSGTVAAAMEATLLGIPAIALSQNYNDGEAIPWATAAQFAPEVIRRLTELPWPEHTLINVNFPAAPPQEVRGIVPTSQGKRAIADNLTRRLDPRGRPYYWIGPVRENGVAEPGTDLAAIANRQVSVTPVYLDLTNIPVLAALKKVFA